MKHPKVMPSLTLAGKLSLGFTIVSMLSSLILVILLAIKLKYSVTSSQGTRPTFKTTPQRTCPCDLTTATSNEITINYRKGGAAIYTLALISFTLSFTTVILITQNDVLPHNLQT